jgi:alpha-L-arabinofuranosidase
VTWNRYVLLVVALLVVVALIAPTGGVSSSAIDRNVDVAVASDDEAYLGIQRECRDNASQVTITNRFSSGTTLDVNIAVNGTTKTIDDLAAGGQETKQFNTFDTDDTVTIDASGSGISVHLTRSLPTGC